MPINLVAPGAGWADERGTVMGDGKHTGEDDKQTDHAGKGSDGRTVESGDDK